MRTLEQAIKYELGLYLRKQGISMVRISNMLDVGLSTARAWFDVKYVERQKARARRNYKKKGARRLPKFTASWDGTAPLAVERDDQDAV